MTRSQDFETAPFANGRTAVPKIQVAQRSHAARRPKSPVARRSPAGLRARLIECDRRGDGLAIRATRELRIGGKEILAKAREIRGKDISFPGSEQIALADLPAVWWFTASIETGWICNQDLF